MRVRLALIPLVAAAALLGGCATTGAANGTPTTAPAGNGVAALSADEIAAKAKTALAAAKSFHIKGTTVDNGTPITVDVSYAGKDFAGSVQVEGINVDIIVLGANLYLKAPDAFWTQLIPPGQQSALTALKGKWVKVSTSMPGFSDFSNTIDTNDLVKGKLTKGDTATINGMPAIGVIDEDKSTMYVATQGEPYPVELVDKDGKKLDFSQFNSANAITAPADADVFDLGKLMGG